MRHWFSTASGVDIVGKFEFHHIVTDMGTGQTNSISRIFTCNVTPMWNDVTHSLCLLFLLQRGPEDAFSMTSRRRRYSRRRPRATERHRQCSGTSTRKVLCGCIIAQHWGSGVIPRKYALLSKCLNYMEWTQCPLDFQGGKGVFVIIVLLPEVNIIASHHLFQPFNNHFGREVEISYTRTRFWVDIYRVHVVECICIDHSILYIGQCLLCWGPVIDKLSICLPYHKGKLFAEQCSVCICVVASSRIVEADRLGML